MSALCQKRTSQVCAVKRFLFSDRLSDAKRRAVTFFSIAHLAVHCRKQERNKNRSCVRYRADLLLVTRIMQTGWLRFSIAARTPAFVFKATQPKRNRLIMTVMFP